MTEPDRSSLPRKGQASVPPTLWDPLVRVSHWGIAAVVLANFALNKAGGWVHVTLGWVGLTLLLLRLIWGVVGAPEARFASFPPNPRAALGHLVALARGKPPHYASHNPAGAMMAYALWACLAVVTLTGLTMTDFKTPMAQAKVESVVAKGDWSTLEGQGDDNAGAKGVVKEVHEIFANLILLLAVLHVLGVVVEGRALRRNLVAAMVLGASHKGPKP